MTSFDNFLRRRSSVYGVFVCVDRVLSFDGCLIYLPPRDIFFPFFYHGIDGIPQFLLPCLFPWRSLFLVLFPFFSLGADHTEEPWEALICFFLSVLVSRRGVFFNDLFSRSLLDGFVFSALMKAFDRFIFKRFHPRWLEWGSLLPTCLNILASLRFTPF